MHPKTSIVLGVFMATLAMSAGAVGSYALDLDAEHMATWKTGVEYHMWHAMALVVYGLFRVVKQGNGVAAWGFILGTLLFSGSIYALSLELLPESLEMITHIGGGVLLAGWITWFFQSMKKAG